MSERAIRADDMYADYAGSHNFYVTARGHDLHLMMHTCMFLGQYVPALAAADKIRTIMTEDILTMKDRPKLVDDDGRLLRDEDARARPVRALARDHRRAAAGRSGDLPVSTPMHHYARGIAYATLKDPAAADRERALFREAVARMPADRKFLSNLAHTTLGVGEAMLDGEVEYHRGNHEQAFAHLREAVHRDDSLNYTEPWAWMHPPRHALAALLMEQGHHAEAEAVYRDDLGLSGRIQRCTQHPDNVWALHGLVECLQRRGETRGAAGSRGQARRGPGQGRRADHLVLHVPDQGPSGQGVLRLKATMNSRKTKKPPGKPDGFF